jgi:hypothetical protein
MLDPILGALVITVLLFVAYAGLDGVRAIIRAREFNHIDPWAVRRVGLLNLVLSLVIWAPFLQAIW